VCYYNPSNFSKISYKSANIEDDARLDMSAKSFWGWDRKIAFFDVKVFNPLAPSYSSGSMLSSS